MVLRTCSFLVAAAVAVAPATADACQYPECHSDGAVAKPADFDLSLPFKEGENVKILSGYGPNAGSSLHCRAQDGQCANDYYALDLILPDHPNYGKGQPVLASASGTVLDAGWGTSGWASYGQRVYIRHDYAADGHTYVTMYAHLDSVAVTKGQKVARGDILGTLGQSCNEMLACPNFSTPHVHFSLHRDSNFGGSGSGGSYGGRAVIPEPIDGHGGLSQGDIVVSKNGAEEEPPPPPPPPPGECAAIPPAGAILDEEGPCAAPIGDALTDAGGHNGHAYWTPLAHPSPDYDQGLLFILNFEQAGTYALSAHVPAAIDDRAPAATYKIAHAGGSDKALVDQTQGVDVWLPLGTFSFNAGQVDQWIRIGNNFELPEHEGTKLALDAIKVEPGANCECTEAGAIDTLPCGVGGEQTRTCDGCDWGPWSPCSDGGTTGESTGEPTGGGEGSTGATGSGGGPTSGPAGTGGVTGSDSSGPGVTTLPASSGPGWGGSSESGGCACASDMPDRTWPLGLLALLLLAPRRRARARTGRGA